MLPLEEMQTNEVKFVFTDIDDTLTQNGKIYGEVYQTLWNLQVSGYTVIPVTGRPAGWCEMIARTWPVGGVIGENGALFYQLKNNRMNRTYSLDPKTMSEKRDQLSIIKETVLSEIPTVSVASDQFCRIFDLAIDFAEDVEKQPDEVIQRIVEVFKSHGAQAKVSSIHVNGWFGDFDKLTMCKRVLEEVFAVKGDDTQRRSVFVGDSPNDEPMFDHFDNSVGVANILDFKDSLRSPPTFVTKKRYGEGFIEVAKHIQK